MGRIMDSARKISQARWLRLACVASVLAILSFAIPYIGVIDRWLALEALVPDVSYCDLSNPNAEEIDRCDNAAWTIFALLTLYFWLVAASLVYFFVGGPNWWKFWLSITLTVATWASIFTAGLMQRYSITITTDILLSGSILVAGFALLILWIYSMLWNRD